MLRKLFYYWLPLFFWMGMIFFGSSQTKASISPSVQVNFVFFKSLHLLEYAILYFLWFRALYSFHPHKKKLKLCLSIAFLITIFYSSTDEFHQLYIPTRNGSLRDIFIDSLGMLIMYFGIQRFFPLIKKIL